MKIILITSALIGALSLTACKTTMWSFVQIDAGRDRKDPNEVFGVSAGVPVIPLEARLSLETKEKD